MQSRDQKRWGALERIEKKLIAECEFVSNNPQQYSKSCSYDILFDLSQANHVRRVLGMNLLSIDQYEQARGNLVITDGYSQFYPKEN